MLAQNLRPSQPTAIVDIGANPVDGDPPYKVMLDAGLCTVTGFEPQPAAREELLKNMGPLENYLPDAVGDGGVHLLHVTEESGMTSLFEPDPARLRLFNGFRKWGQVKQELSITTRRLDDIDAVRNIDFLKMDIQGGELMVLTGGRSKLSRAVMIQTEIPFIPLYKNQPSYGEIDLELRAQGFVPHSLFNVKRWAVAPIIFAGDLRVGGNQLLEADVVYVRDFGQMERMDDEQIKHLCLISHAVYGSTDLAHLCLLELAARRVIELQTVDEYRADVGVTRT
jgi:FkbM family methyltransferase